VRARLAECTLPRQLKGLTLLHSCFRWSFPGSLPSPFPSTVHDIFKSSPKLKHLLLQVAQQEQQQDREDEAEELGVTGGELGVMWG